MSFFLNPLELKVQTFVCVFFFNSNLGRFGIVGYNV